MATGQISIPEALQSRNPHLSLSEMEHSVATLIRRRDPDNPVPVSAISVATGLSDRSARNLIRSLVVDHGLPIGSISAADKPGFYWITDTQELRKAADRYRRRGINTIIRGQRLMALNKDELMGQLEAALED